MKTHRSQHPVRHGFTLVELLVVSIVIVVLVALFLGLMQNARKSARKTKAVSQMREIGVGVATWAAEKNNGEPMYVTGGIDNSGETYYAGRDKNVCAGNPANILYNKDNPEDGYVTDHTTFFSPIHKWTVPAKADYDSWTASPTKLWGTFCWVYPSIPMTELTQRHKNAKCGGSFVTVSPEAYNNALMFDDYSYAKPLYPKLYYVLFRDGSVRQVAPNGDIWGWFY